MSYLNLHNIIKRFGQTEVVKNLTLHVEQGELISFLGPSGCGKTTTLNMIAGFLDLDEGRIEVDGQPVHHLQPHKRNMGMVFQNYALFPHMTVFENVAFGLKLRKVPRHEIENRVKAALQMTRLEHLAGRYPKELSGGQQQRVAISRALVIEPTVLLLDEPLSNLDAKLRQEMRDEITEIQQKVGITTIFVTHDQEEALAISNRIAVMNGGKIEQLDSPENIYKNPKTAFVASFIGEVNQLTGKFIGLEQARSKVELHGNVLQLPKRIEQQPNQEVTMFIRPEKLLVSKSKPQSHHYLAARVERSVFLGSKTRYVMNMHGQQVVAERSNAVDHEEFSYQDEVYLYWNDDDLLVSGSEG